MRINVRCIKKILSKSLNRHFLINKSSLLSQIFVFLEISFTIKQIKQQQQKKSEIESFPFKPKLIYALASYNIMEIVTHAL